MSPSRSASPREGGGYGPGRSLRDGSGVISWHFLYRSIVRREAVIICKWGREFGAAGLGEARVYRYARRQGHLLPTHSRKMRGNGWGARLWCQQWQGRFRITVSASLFPLMYLYLLASFMPGAGGMSLTGDGDGTDREISFGRCSGQEDWSIFCLTVYGGD